jgi:hypothetical protein
MGPAGARHGSVERFPACFAGRQRYFHPAAVGAEAPYEQSHMPVLNEELSWMEVGRIVTDPSSGATVSDAFQLMFGPPSKDLIPESLRLYTFNDFSSPARSNQPTEPLSPGWRPSLQYKHDGGLQQKLKIAELNGMSAREWGRLTSVVKENWNSLSFIFEIELSVPVYGWFGGFRGMSRIDRDPETGQPAPFKRRSGEPLGRCNRPCLCC